MLARVVAIDELSSGDLAGWDQCARAAIEPNPFFEPGWLLPALRFIGESPGTLLVIAEHGGDVQCCVPVCEVHFNPSGGGHDHPVLNTRVAAHAVPVGTPIVSKDAGAEAVACVLDAIDGLARQRDCALVVMEWLVGDGPVARLLRGVSTDQGIDLGEFDHWERGFLDRRTGGGDEYWLSGIGKNRRRSIRQHRTRLAHELGMDPVVRVETDGAAAKAFLRLEMAGWKGHDAQGEAFGRQPETTAFFEEVCRTYLDNGRMSFLCLEGPESPVAMICCVRAGEGLFAYRTAYDERLAQYGPGVQVFLSAMEHFDRSTDACWFDSCAAPGNEHLLGLFPDRRTMSTFVRRVRHAR
jgi:hypothetical protein